ncbi:MAG: TIGR04282 family arsenosugar biosynthesis glycosyltransferase [Bacteroidota bacterium]
MSELLIVFCKNPEPGKVKTRLAKDIGYEKAFHVYEKLMEHTQRVAEINGRDYAIYYSDYINKDDIWNNAVHKVLQTGSNMGERMSNAMADGLSKGYRSVVLVGADIYDLTSDIIDYGFQKLTRSDVVIGPAKDGGYYLIGLKSEQREIFNIEKWSVSSVLKDTLNLVNTLGLSYQLLDELNDIDDLDDLKETDLIRLI